jgi:methylated-DNA-[protein]-cysteine S-methyltransferase
MSFNSILPSPLGTMVIKSDAGKVNFIGFDETITEENPDTTSELAKIQLLEYFEAGRSSFDFPIEQTGSEFQQKVWNELMRISIGSPISYATLSKRMNSPLAIRGIASANGKNKLMIVVPCHRVIGSNGDLVGYAGGLWRKKWLLEHEAKITKTGQSSLF